MLKQQLVEFVQLFVEQKIRETQLTDGTVTEWGSDKHITELERQVAEIQHRRKRSPRGSAARADYRRAEARLKAELTSARKASERRQLQEIPKEEI